jgi:acyl-CoA synthetase (AMP-forming)/AMP-acid ligase II
VEILTSQSAAADAEWLRSAWRRPESFILVPAKSGLEPNQIARFAELVPEQLRTEHFGLFTSGSTGEPRLVLGSRARATRLVEILHDLQHGDPVAETTLVLPLSYTYAFVNQWLWSERFGRRLVTTAGFSRPDALAADLARAEQAMLCLVGIHVPLLVAHYAGARFPGVIRLHFAGGRFPQEHLAVLRDFFPNAEIFNNFGCAEAMPRLTLRRAEDADDAADVGFPLPGVELRVSDTEALEFRSPYGAVGVVEADRFIEITPETWVPTGDLGGPTPRGSWQVTGRATEVFKRHGEKVSLQSLLAAVHGSWPGQAAFYREADAQGEEGHVLALSPIPTETELRDLLVTLRKSFSRAQWPLRIEGLPSGLPLLPNGKPDARAIPAQPGRQDLWHQRIGG